MFRYLAILRSTAERIDIQDHLAARLDIQAHVIQRLLVSAGVLSFAKHGITSECSELEHPGPCGAPHAHHLGM